MKNAVGIVIVLVGWIGATTLAAGSSAPQPITAGGFDVHAAERFAKLALACVEKEYPNKISHVLNSDSDVAAETFASGAHRRA